jgi:hypothetical protein
VQVWDVESNNTHTLYMGITSITYKGLERIFGDDTRAKVVRIKHRSGNVKASTGRVKEMSEELLREELTEELTKHLTILDNEVAVLQTEAEKLRKLVSQLKEGKDPLG